MQHPVRDNGKEPLPRSCVSLSVSQKVYCGKMADRMWMPIELVIEISLVCIGHCAASTCRTCIFQEYVMYMAYL